MHIVTDEYLFFDLLKPVTILVSYHITSHVPKEEEKKKKEKTFRRKITEQGNKVIFWSGHVWSSSGRMNARVRTAPGAKSPLLREGIEPRNRRGRRIARRTPGKETREEEKKK